MRNYLLIALLTLTLTGTTGAQEAPEAVAATNEAVAWKAAAEMRYAQLALESAESETHFNHKMRELNLEKAQAQAKADAIHRERKHAMELREREAALQKAAVPTVTKSGDACSSQGCCALLLVAAAIVHLLLAIWVYQDIRRRNAGSGIWIVIVLISGLLGAFVFALVRLGDNRGVAGS